MSLADKRASYNRPLTRTRKQERLRLIDEVLIFFLSCLPFPTLRGLLLSI